MITNTIVLGRPTHSLATCTNYLTLLAAVPQDLSPQDELPNNWPDEATEDELDESEPWYGNDVDGAEYYGAPSSPASTQDFNGRGGEASPESLVGRSRKRKSEFEPDVAGDEA